MLDAAVQRAYRRMAADLRRVFGDRFVALIAHGPGAAVAFAASIGVDDLHALGPLADAWRHDGLETPLVMTPAEFRRSLDTFPAEYQALLDHHVVIDGTSPFEGAAIGREDLRRACEAQARGHLIHLRQGCIDAGSRHHGVERVIEESAGPLRRLLRNLARLQDEEAADDAALAAFAERRAGMSASLVAAVLAVERAPHQAYGLVAQLSGRSAAVEHRHDRVQIDPRHALQATQHARQARAAAEAPHFHRSEPHAGIVPANVQYL